MQRILGQTGILCLTRKGHGDRLLEGAKNETWIEQNQRWQVGIHAAHGGSTSASRRAVPVCQASSFSRLDQFVLHSLMISFRMVVQDILCDRPLQ